MKTLLPILTIIAALAMIAALALVVSDSGPPTAKDLGYNLEELGLEKGDMVYLWGVVSGSRTEVRILENNQKGITVMIVGKPTYFPWSSVKGIGTSSKN